MGGIIEAIILDRKFHGDMAFLPRMSLIPSESVIPFKRLQFSKRIAYAMAINKSQDQTMNFWGINSENLCFSHGQCYVLCAKDRKPNNLIIYTPMTKNVVYSLTLQ